MSDRRSFARSFASLHEIFAFTAESFQRLGVPSELRPSVDLVLEELFTNIVKYGAGDRPVSVEMARVARGVEVTMTEFDADHFDVTDAPSVDVTRPAEEREPGKLGLHLLPRLVDSLSYEYVPAERIGRTTFRKLVAPGARPGFPDEGPTAC